MVYKRVRGWTSGRSLPVLSFVKTTPFPRVQLFRQRLSHGSTKAQATMPIGIMRSNSLALLGWGSRRLARRKEKAWIRLFLLLPSLTPKYLELQSINPSINQSIKCKTIVTHNIFRHYRVHFYAFVRQPFSKPLYWMKQHIAHCRWDFQVSFSKWNNCILKLINNSSS